MSLTPMTLQAVPGSGHEVVWELPMPDWAYGVIALAAFMLLLLITWLFRNAGHTLMEGPDMVPHVAPGTATAQGGHSSTH
ncbi:hypothetical protein KEM60_00622 [Austwickia sp. TVS 96-490-7B]|uniref:hypothetical protein n=1 Tax=Austwickia sp. TVS 96-490-7B TaxID=2830843 RepID=UPI001C59DCF7|nr:hypothetical protein [Austwickia sp. TVS 96-490-7B]MBW3084434.1 hypothetical protein [Austwickia sp. TVS 96-490-7B]